MAGSPGMLIYAELLSNIRQISVACSLPTPASPADTHAGISPDGLRLTVRHSGREHMARLPVRAAPIASLPIAAGASSLAWRLSLAASTAAGGGGVVVAPEETTPWAAMALDAGSAVACRACGATVVGAGVLAVWKDLPSENWAEMMEFWHCHKPHPEHGQHDRHDHNHAHGEDGKQGEDVLAGRGYGANSRISAQPGTGFVDLTSFLFFERDCAGLSMVSAFLSLSRKISCFQGSGLASMIWGYT
jgi:ubiquitin-protein ligase E3 D